jgi:Ran GTPase-activating protein (RanGAP) involved in mRNA processing and transport
MIMLSRTSKRVKEVVDKMLLPAVVRLSRSFWDDARNDTEKAKCQFVFRQLVTMTVRWHTITDLNGNSNFGSAGTKRLAEVLGTCRELTHLNLRWNDIGSTRGKEVCRSAVLGQCASLVHLNLNDSQIGPVGAENLGEVLTQCTALTHLNLGDNQIGDAGAERLSGVMGQWRELVHLNLRYNLIGPGGQRAL